jgi:hypothetical protein
MRWGWTEWLVGDCASPADKAAARFALAFDGRGADGAWYSVHVFLVAMVIEGKRGARGSSSPQCRWLLVE